MKPSHHSEAAAGGVAPETVRTPETEEQPKYLLVTAGELMSLLNKPLIEGQTETSVWGRLVNNKNPQGESGGEDGNLQKLGILKKIRFNLVRKSETTRGLQFLIPRPPETGESDVSQDGVLQLQENEELIPLDQVLNEDGFCEIDAQEFLQELFNNLYAMGRLEFDEKDLMRAETTEVEFFNWLLKKIEQGFKDAKLKITFSKSRWEEAGGKPELLTETIHVLSDEELTDRYRRQKIAEALIPEMVEKTPLLARRVVVPQLTKFTTTAYITSIEMVELAEQDENEVETDEP